MSTDFYYFSKKFQRIFFLSERGCSTPEKATDSAAFSYSSGATPENKKSSGLFSRSFALYYIRIGYQSSSSSSSLA